MDVFRDPPSPINTPRPNKNNDCLVTKWFYDREIASVISLAKLGVDVNWDYADFFKHVNVVITDHAQNKKADYMLAQTCLMFYVELYVK